MRSGRRRNWLLLIPLSLVLASIAGAVAAGVYVIRNPGGLENIVFFLFALAMLAPLFLSGFVWFLMDLRERRPLRRDVLGWIVWVPVFAVSAVFAVVGISRAPGMYEASQYSGGGIFPVIPFVAMAAFGVWGLVVAFNVLRPLASARVVGGSGPPDEPGDR